MPFPSAPASPAYHGGMAHPELLPAPSRVLVTGAGGLIGSEVCRVLAQDGVAVTALDRRFDERPPADRVITGAADDVEVIRDALEGCDAAVHLAAIPSPHGHDPREVYATNVLSTFTVLSTAGEAGVRRIAIASSINATGVPFNHRRPLPAYYPLDEDLPLELDDAYSLSKASDELTARMAASRWGLRVIALRLPLTADDERLQHAARAARADPESAVREGWSYLHREDAARAFADSVRAPGEGCDILFLSAADTLLAEPTEALLERWAPGVPRRSHLEGRAAAIDTSRARELIGFRPTRRLDG